MIYGWNPTLGDPTAYGWITVAAYFATASLCTWAARSCRVPSGAGDFMQIRMRSRRRFWIVLAVILFALGVNKQLDLQSLLTAIGRHVAQAEGWYAKRRGLQSGFIGTVVLFGLCAVGIMLLIARRAGGWALLAVTGLGLLATFIVIRAASFHDFDLLIRSRIARTGWGEVRINHLLELCGITIVALAALGAGFTVGKSRPRRRSLRSRR